MTTDTTDLVDVPVRLDIDKHAATYVRAMGGLDRAATKEADRVGLDQRLRHLVKLRASQLNGCAYCVDMHSKDAAAVGETQQRLHAVAVWREVPFFTARERAALAFTESVTQVASTHVPAADYEAVAAEYSPDEVAALLAVIVTINAWNALAVSTRAWVPGSYEP
jgi:AhpD family alkylhydroperoxidase